MGAATTNFRGWQVAATVHPDSVSSVERAASPSTVTVTVEVMMGGGTLQHCSLEMAYAAGGTAIAVDLGELREDASDRMRTHPSVLRTKGLVDGLPRNYASLLPDAISREAARLAIPSGTFTVAAAGYDPVETSSGSFWRAGTIAVWLIQARLQGLPFDADALNLALAGNWIEWKDWQRRTLPGSPDVAQ